MWRVLRMTSPVNPRQRSNGNNALNAKAPNDHALRKRIGFILLLALYNATCFFSLLFPASITPDLVTHFATTASMIQLSISIVFISYCLFGFILGLYIQRVGRRTLMLCGLFGLLLSNLCVIMSDHVAVFMMSRLLLGASMVVLNVLPKAMARDVYEGKRLTTIISFVLATVGLTSSGAALLGGVVAQVYGWQMLYYVLVVIALFLWLASLVWLRETKTHYVPGQSVMTELTRYITLTLDKRLLSYLVLDVCVTTLFGFNIMVLPFIGKTQLALSVWAIGLLVSAPSFGYMLGSVLNTGLIRVMRSVRIIAMASGGTLLVAIGLYFVRDGHILGLLIALLVGLGISQGLIETNAIGIPLGLFGRDVGKVSVLLSVVPWLIASPINGVMSYFHFQHIISISVAIGLAAIVLMGVSRYFLMKEKIPDNGGVG